MHQKLIKAAQELGIEVVDLSSIGAKEVLLFKKNDVEILFKEGFPLNQLNLQTEFWLNNKQLTKQTFQKLGINYPQSIVIEATQNEEAIAAFWKESRIYVAKPLYGTDGDGVAMHIKEKQQLTDYLQVWKSKYQLFLLEEQIEGEDLRIHVLGGKIVAACCRKSAYVIGDEKQSIEMLIKQRAILIQQQNPANQLIIDSTTKELLAAQKVNLTTIPKKGQIIQLKYVANMSQGGIAIDVTDEIHPEYQNWVSKLSKELNTTCFALDAISTNHKTAPQEVTWALEINPKPHWLHHTFSERKQHPMAKMILEEVFALNK